MSKYLGDLTLTGDSTFVTIVIILGVIFGVIIGWLITRSFYRYWIKNNECWCCFEVKK